MDVKVKVWFWSNKFQWFFLKHFDRRKILNIYIKIIPFCYITAGKEKSLK